MTAVDLRRVASGQHPHDVARLAQKWAIRRGFDARTRPLLLEKLSPFIAESDPTGRHFGPALGAYARTIRHVREPGDVGEVVLDPWKTAELRAGDCDDLAALIAAFAACVGLPCAIGVYPTGPGSAHVVALVGDTWNTTSRRLAWQVDNLGARPFPSANPSIAERCVRLFRVR